MEKLTKKEKIARWLLSQQDYRSVMDISVALGITTNNISSAMKGILRERRYKIETQVVDNPKQGPKKLKKYHVLSITPLEDAVAAQEKESRISWTTDPDVSHLLCSHNPVWHQAICQCRGIQHG